MTTDLDRVKRDHLIVDELARRGGRLCRTPSAPGMWSCTSTNGPGPQSSPGGKTRPSAGDGKMTPDAGLRTVWNATTNDRTRIVRYLESRGLPGKVLEGISDDVLRFHPALPYWEYDDAGNNIHVGDFPAMVAKVKDQDGNTVTLHRTYLDTDGPGKAPVQSPKKLMTATSDGATNGAAIRLFPAGSVLGLAEGIETALAVHAATGQRVWSCVSAGGLERVILPQEVSRVHLWADNDASGRGEQAAKRLADRLCEEDRTVYLHLPRTPGTDWLDVYIAFGESALMDELTQCTEWTPGHLAHDDNPGTDGDIGAELDRLAGLDTVAYELERTEAAKALGMRASVLDAVVKARRESAKDSGGLFLVDPDRWPEEVDGAVLLDELTERVRLHVSLPYGAAEIIALWIIHSHAHDAADVSPILAITSPTPECGKTTTLTVLQGTVRKPLQTANITAAALFRGIEKWKPTLLIDECDTFLKGSDELRGVLDSGHVRSSAQIIRTVGDDYEPRVFHTWAPKAIALIGRLPPTLASRSIHVELKRLARGEKVEPLRLDRLDILRPLQEKAARWASDHLDSLKAHDPDIPAGLYGRAADNWRTLLAIADVAGGSWPEKAREVALSTNATQSEQTAGVLLLEDLRQLFGVKDRLKTDDILAALNAMDDRPWPEWSRGREMTAPKLSKLLQPFGIKSRTIKLPDGLTAKGYRLQDCADAFSRYLTPSQSVTPSPSAVRAGLRPSQSVTSNNPGYGNDPAFLALESQGDGVTAKIPPWGSNDPLVPDWWREEYGDSVEVIEV